MKVTDWDDLNRLTVYILHPHTICVFLNFFEIFSKKSSSVFKSTHAKKKKDLVARGMVLFFSAAVSRSI